MSRQVLKEVEELEKDGPNVVELMEMAKIFLVILVAAKTVVVVVLVVLVAPRAMLSARLCYWTANEASKISGAYGQLL